MARPDWAADAKAAGRSVYKRKTKTKATKATKAVKDTDKE